MSSDRWPPQGPALQGFGPGEQEGGVCEGTQTDLPRRFRLDGMVTAGGKPILGARVEPSRLVGKTARGASLEGEAWVGVRLRSALDCVEGPALETEARIAAVTQDPEASRPGALLYRVEVLDPATAAWMPLCNARDRGKGEAEVLAMPFAGEWDSHGELHETPGTFTFACTTAAAAKCDHWGYGPWGSPAHAETGPPVKRREAHQACIRMARADYCGDGRSWTTLGTEINIWDSAGLHDKAAPRDGAGFEAAWRSEGAICADHMRHPELLDPGLQCALPRCSSEQEAAALVTGPQLLVFNESQIRSASEATRSASR
jgi:hypothetical protein